LKGGNDMRDPLCDKKDLIER